MRTTGQKNPDIFAQLRHELIDENFSRYGIRSEKVLMAIDQVPREEFVPEEERYLAYVDRPLPIGFGQTISQPSLVALMAQYLETKPSDRVLEIGTGCGYNAAVLSHLVKDVFSVEVIRPLYLETRNRLQNLGFSNIHLKCGDGNLGWPEKGPFDSIILTAAPVVVPLVLFSQLKPGGFLVAPMGTRDDQRLVRYHKDQRGSLSCQNFMPVRFVRMQSSRQLY